MNTYHKIQTVFKRSVGGKQLLEGEYSLPEFEFLRDNDWTFTEKVDGTNIRVIWGHNAGISLGGKTDNAQIPAPLFLVLQHTFLTTSCKDIFNTIFGETAVCLYGEGYGPKIQNGGNYRSDPGFVLFDVKVGEWWLQRDAIEDVASKLNLDVVPIIGQGTLREMVSHTKAGITSTWGDFPAEGIVAKPRVELQTRSGHRIITKIKTKDFK